jgi:hypothetical protein
MEPFLGPATIDNKLFAGRDGVVKRRRRTWGYTIWLWPQAQKIKCCWL